MRQISEREYCHEELGESFARALSEYDTRRRVETLIDEFLTDVMVRNKKAIDVGCGLGFFSQRLQERGANVVACDIGSTLLEFTARRVGCRCVVADALSLVDQFGESSFDLVVSSECIEHTPNPKACLRQMARILWPGGYLTVSTPNVVWFPVVRLASALRLRPFHGLENFCSWSGLRSTLQQAGIGVIREKGLHLFPFQLGMHGFSTWCDHHLQVARRLMINICILGRKASPLEDGHTPR